MPANDIPQTAEGSPMPLEHTRSCGALIQNACTCGLAWRIRLATEQEMHAAWRKRAEEAEALQPPPPREAAPDGSVMVRIGPVHLDQMRGEGLRGPFDRIRIVEPTDGEPRLEFTVATPGV